MEPKDTSPEETVSAPTPESTATPQATDSTVEPAKEQIEQPVQTEDAEALRKQLQKLEMERNLLKNKTEKFEREQEEKRQAELSEVERLKEQLSEYEQKEALKEAENFRATVLEEYLKDSPDTLKVAKALIDKNPSNLTWGDGLTEEEAKAELHEQLAALKEVIGTRPDTSHDGVSVSPNNPSPERGETLDRAQMIEQAAKTRDFSEILKTLPSVQEQIKKLNE